jgi:hypothetical protein
VYLSIIYLCRYYPSSVTFPSVNLLQSFLPILSLYSNNVPQNHRLTPSLHQISFSLLCVLYYLSITSPLLNLSICILYFSLLSVPSIFTANQSISLGSLPGFVAYGGAPMAYPTYPCTTYRWGGDARSYRPIFVRNTIWGKLGGGSVVGEGSRNTRVGHTYHVMLLKGLSSEI